MKILFATLALIFSLEASAKQICVASCVTAILKNHETLKVLDVNTVISNGKVGALDAQCPNTLEGDTKEGKQQYLGEVKCLAI